MMTVLRLVMSLIALANKLAGAIRDTVLRKRIWKEYRNEQIAKETEKVRRARKARIARRSTDRGNPDRRLQNDGFRRD